MSPVINVVVYARCSHADVRLAVLSAVRALTATSSGPVRETLTNVGNVTLTHIREAFLAKSRGGTDQAGDRWDRLKPTTVARKRAAKKRLGILRSTDALLKSLSPDAVSDPHMTQVSGRIFVLGRGSVTVGTRRPGAAAHHAGVPGRLPQRRLWPQPTRWPASWWRGICDQVVRGVVDLTLLALRGST